MNLKLVIKILPLIKKKNIFAISLEKFSYGENLLAPTERDKLSFNFIGIEQIHANYNHSLHLSDFELLWLQPLQYCWCLYSTQNKKKSLHETAIKHSFSLTPHALISHFIMHEGKCTRYKKIFYRYIYPQKHRCVHVAR